MRILAALVTIVLTGWFGFALFHVPDSSGASTRPGAPTPWVSSQQCRECHPRVYDEWLASPHANSWNNEDVRVQSNDFANKDCIDCHAPRPVFETGIAERVLPRASRRSEGVDCITCHLLPDGRMAATLDNPRAACQPVTRRELQRSQFCAGCHDQHKTVQQWMATPFADEGKDCIACHMPHRGGDPNQGRVHTMPGGHYPEMVRAAVLLRGRPNEAGDGWVVTVENHGAGHAFPTDERSRAADVWWRPLPDDPSTLDENGVTANGGDWRHLHRIRDPYRHESHIVSTLLMYGEARDLALTDAEAADGAEVVLVYKRAPYYRDPGTGESMRTEDVTDPFIDAELVHRIVLTP